MSDTLRRFVIVTVTILATYVVLHVLRSFHVAAEPRGIIAGITGYVTADLVKDALSHRRRRKRPC